MKKTQLEKLPISSSISKALLPVMAIFGTLGSLHAQTIRVQAEHPISGGRVLEPFGKVLVKRVTVPTSSSIGSYRNGFRSLAIPRVKNTLLNSRLFRGSYVHHYAAKSAYSQVFRNGINARRANTNGIRGSIVTAGNLNAMRARIRGNGGTFIFRGNGLLVVTNPIEVGSNTQIWIDQRISYRGPRSLTSPRPNNRPEERFGVFYSTNKQNVRISGTKRGYIDGLHNRVRKLNGILLTDCRNSFVRNVTVAGAREGIKIAGCRNTRVERNVTVDCDLRGIWAKGGRGNDVIGNLMARNGADGLDIDAFSSDFDAINNVVYHQGLDGGRPSRNMIWTEVASNNCRIRLNVGIQGPAGGSGIRENGSNANESAPATRNNTWTNNAVYYAGLGGGAFSGVSSNRNQKINYSTMTFRNNQVYLDTRDFTVGSLERRFTFGNMALNTSILNDVIYHVRR